MASRKLFGRGKMEHTMELCDRVEINSKGIAEQLNREDLSEKKKLVLIQAPSDFDIKSLTGQKLNLEGYQNLPTDENSEQARRYEVKSSMNCRKNMKSYSVIIPSFEHKKYCVGRPIHGSLVITQTIKVPQVYLPDMEEVVLPEVAKRFLHRWIPFGAGDPVNAELTRKRTREEKDEPGKETSFEILSSIAQSNEIGIRKKDKKKMKLQSADEHKNEKIKDSHGHEKRKKHELKQ